MRSAGCLVQHLLSHWEARPACVHAQAWYISSCQIGPYKRHICACLGGACTVGRVSLLCLLNAASRCNKHLT